jgi:hypothetical protein
MLKTSFLTALLAAALAVPALAQIDPNDTGAGLVRGLESMNSSAQVGEVRIQRGSGTPTLTLDVKGTAGHPEAVTLNRGKDCSALEATPQMVLGSLSNGRLHATSPLPADRLLSGNYNAVVHNNTPTSRPVACGHIYVR